MLKKLNHELVGLKDGAKDYAEAYVISTSYSYHISDIDTKLKKLTTTHDSEGKEAAKTVFTEEEKEALDALKDERTEYVRAKEPLDATIKAYQNDPKHGFLTAKDRYILNIVAHANMVSFDPAQSGSVKYGKPTVKSTSGKKVEAIPGWSAFEKAMGNYVWLTREGKNTTTEFKQAKKDAERAFYDLIKHAFNVDNNSEYGYMHSTIFADRKYTLRKERSNIVGHFAVHFAIDRGTNNKGEKYAKINGTKAFNSFCDWFYYLVTTGEDTDAPFTKSEIKFYEPETENVEPKAEPEPKSEPETEN